MEAVAIGLVLSMFSTVNDPRAANARHRLVDILAIALLAMLAGADDYPGIVEFALDRVELLGGLLAFAARHSVGQHVPAGLCRG